MITDTTAAARTATGTGSTAPISRNDLGKDDFLRLLTAQLANQDPLQPTDNQAFIAQLAQFSSLEQLQGVSSRLDTLLVAQTSGNQLTAASLVGKTVSWVTGVDAAGQAIRASGPVQGVEFSADGVRLVVDGNRLQLSDVVAITQERNAA